MTATPRPSTALRSVPRWLTGRTDFRLWAPTAQRVSLCLHESDSGAASTLLELTSDPATGIWSGSASGELRGHYYTYLVDVPVRNVGIVRNRVTDPYSLSLGADSQRSYVVDLDDPALKPPGWDSKARPDKVRAQTDMVIYELHVRDFSINDGSVSAPNRGNYLAFTETDSDGMRHLRALSAAGLTDVHLLPVFDLATVPEIDCVTPSPSGGPDSESQQAAVGAVRDRDCFNWGYDPWHYTAPEGSYASDARDGAVRILEFRRMVLALREAGLRVGMDVVYNHTSAAAQDPKSVLDRIVPGYYHRLSADGGIETSTCCVNTATEHRMMARLMIDSAVVWARDYQIDSFRFDLMGHQPRAAMEALQVAVNQATGRHVELLGEGWNFGEVADGRRFVQASQLSLNGSGIATFSDRARDAARGGGCCDGAADLIRRQGYLNGLHYAPNAQAQGQTSATDLLRAADMLRVGLAGSLRQYTLLDHRGQSVRLEQIDYAGGQPAGYVSEPFEVVNYVENHDNQTLFDINVFKLPIDSSREDRARVQLLGAALVAFSQGIAYYHAGMEVLRSKSMDRNSYDSGDWFNRIDWTLSDNHFGSGLPPAWDNGEVWPLMRPLLANPAIKPTPAEIRWMRDGFLDLLRIRSSSTLFRLRSADDVSQRLRFRNTGPDQLPTVLVGQLDGRGYPGAAFAEILYFINVDLQPHRLELPGEAGKDWRLHPVQGQPHSQNRHRRRRHRRLDDGRRAGQGAGSQYARHHADRIRRDRHRRRRRGDHPADQGTFNRMLASTRTTSCAAPRAASSWASSSSTGDGSATAISIPSAITASTWRACPSTHFWQQAAAPRQGRRTRRLLVDGDGRPAQQVHAAFRRRQVAAVQHRLRLPVRRRPVFAASCATTPSSVAWCAARARSSRSTRMARAASSSRSSSRTAAVSRANCSSTARVFAAC
jgi:pullulanase